MLGIIKKCTFDTGCDEHGCTLDYALQAYFTMYMYSPSKSGIYANKDHVLVGVSVPTCKLLRLLEWISDSVIFPQHNLLLLFRRNVLDPDLFRHVLCESPDEPGIPQLRRNTEIFAAAHESVGLAALGRGGNAVGVKILLLAASDGD
jgi:hypothetical protein